jgi:hypothetical protein
MDYSSLGKTWKHCEGGDTSAEFPMVLIESASSLPLGAKHPWFFFCRKHL